MRKAQISLTKQSFFKDSVSKNELRQKHKVINQFPDFVLEELRANTKNTLSACMSLSELSTWVGTLNANRSQFTSSRSLAKYWILYLQNSSITTFIQEMNQTLRNPYSFTEVIDFLNNSSEAITDLGIVLFSLRFFLNLRLLITHLIHAAISKELSRIGSEITSYS